jgi:hypothetical protein
MFDGDLVIRVHVARQAAALLSHDSGQVLMQV